MFLKVFLKENIYDLTVVILFVNDALPKSEILNMRWELGVKNSVPSAGIYGRLLQSNLLSSLILSKS